MAEINWTAEAEQWLKDIHDYIAQDNPSAAIRVVTNNIPESSVTSQIPGIGP